MPSIFTKIINGDVPSYKIAEDDNCIAFLDVFPLKRGHVLVVPKKEVDYIFDLDSQTYNQLMAFSKTIAVALKKTISCKRVGLTVVGLEVPHAHIHLIPINSVNDMNFANEKLQLTSEEFSSIALQIKENL
ncbi:MAG: HIT family protein [Bacteroidia bacterium]|nr:HIT family protein [Bacteroidia bacterium]